MKHSKAFRPSRGAVLALLAAGALGVGVGAYMRYQVVEPSVVGLACQAGAQTTTCAVRRVFIGIFTHYGFGLTALAAAVLALVRPSSLLIAVSLFAGLIGVVLYNTQLSALALALLPVVFARPAPPKEFQPE